MFLRFLLVALLSIFISCNHEQATSPKEIYGTWILDSTSGTGGKMIAGGPRGHTEFTLRQNESFVYKWSDLDVFNDYSGSFNYVKNKDTSTALLVFSIYPGPSEDALIRLDSMIVLKLNDSSLRTQERESYTLFDSTVVTQNRINLYRKSHAPNKGF
jgi:hypothetical protein